jgi:anaerobic selenocysteine-containing dehydrogenase
MDANARKKFSFNVDRRDFLKIFGAGAVASSAACVRRPVELAIPYVNQPVDFVPGVANYYATTCGECAAGCGVVGADPRRASHQAGRKPRPSDQPGAVFVLWASLACDQ